MKTNITMRSNDRKLFGVIVRQETKTGFLNLSDLQAAYDVARGLHGWSDKKYQDLIQQKENRERIFYILEEQGVISNSDFSEFEKDIEVQGVVRFLKGANVYKVTGNRESRTVWCDPYIWVLIAMELNPKLYAKVVTWLTDGLILNRIEAGEFYKDFARAIAPWKPDYAKVAKSLNYVVFNRHESGIRNTATKEQLSALIDIEKKMAWSIDMGDINTEKELINRLRKVWHKKFCK